MSQNYIVFTLFIFYNDKLYLKLLHINSRNFLSLSQSSLKFLPFCLWRPYASSRRRVPPPLSFLFSSFLFDPSLPLRSHPICGRLWVFELSPAEDPRPIPVGVSFSLVTLRGWLREGRRLGSFFGLGCVWSHLLPFQISGVSC